MNPSVTQTNYFMQSEKSEAYHVEEVEMIYTNPQLKAARKKVQTSSDSAKVLKDGWDIKKIDLKEEFHTLYLNRANEILARYRHASGGVAGVAVDIKHILALALKLNASSLILCHNHPSGTLRPSDQDKRLTVKMRDACSLMDLILLDHIILTKESYYSFADEGEI